MWTKRIHNLYSAFILNLYHYSFIYRYSNANKAIIQLKLHSQFSHIIPLSIKPKYRSQWPNGRLWKKYHSINRDLERMLAPNNYIHVKASIYQCTMLRLSSTCSKHTININWTITLLQQNPDKQFQTLVEKTWLITFHVYIHVIKIIQLIK